MLIGYNTNVKYKGKTYHIQTEDNGPSNPQIVTLLYYQGAILSSKKTNYTHLLGEPGFEEKLRDLMKQQHREMIIELRRIVGGVDKDEVKKEDLAPESTKTNTKKGLDDILIDFITKRGRK